MSDPMAERAVSGGETSDQYLALAKDFLMSFTQILSVSRFHDVDNEAVRVPSVVLSEQTRILCAGDRKISYYCDGGQLFINHRRARMAGGSFQTVQWLMRSLQARGLAGVEFRAAVSPGHLRAFLGAFNAVPRGTPDPADRVEEGLRAAGIDEIVLLRPGGSGTGPQEFSQVDDVTAATLLYAKMVVLLREAIRSWEDKNTRTYLGARITRVIQGVISLAERNPRPFQWLIHVKDDREYLFTHSANVTLLSLLMGLRAGIDRNRLCELGVAALFHDVGHLWLPEDLCAKKEAFTRDEWKKMSLHPIHGVNLLLRTGELNRAILTQLVVVFEHNIAANGYPRTSWPDGLHVFSRIVAIADAYDAMTTRRPFRLPRTPDEAFGELWKDAGKRYDADLLRILINVLGVYPLGTVVRLDTGEWGVVFLVDPLEPRRPLVKLVEDSTGTRVTDGPIIDLAERDGAGKFRRSIVETADPASRGVYVPALVWEGSPA